MKRQPFVTLLTVHWGTGVLASVLAMSVAGTVESQGPTIEGLWKSEDTTIRITVKGDQAEGMFVEVGVAAKALGFKAEETSFTGTVRGPYLHGEQTIRYSGGCHPHGRKVAMMGRVTPNGQVLATHFYSITLDRLCRDTGEYTISESLWHRVAAR